MKKLNINTNGNKKLRNTENVRFIIWNLPAVKTYPFRTAMCEKSCYARKAERVYPTVLPSREQNYLDSLEYDFAENMIYTIEEELKKKKYIGKKVVFRIHESGDFYNQTYFDKWVKIVQHFENTDNIVFLAYTKSLPYVINGGYNGNLFPSKLVIRSSIWKDTAPVNVNLTGILNIPMYTALTQSEMDTERAAGHIFTVCKCDDCATCGECWNKSVKDIICKIH